MQATYNVDKFDAWILHKYHPTKKYASVEEVPNRVIPSEIDAAKSRFRMRFATLMMLVTVAASLGVIFRGKEGVDSTMQENNYQRHKEWAEKHNKSQEK